MDEDLRTLIETRKPSHFSLAKSKFNKFRGTSPITSMQETHPVETRVRSENERPIPSQESETGDIFTIHNPEDSNIKHEDPTLYTDSDRAKIILAKPKSSKTNWLGIYIFLAVSFVLFGLGFGTYAYMCPEKINHHSHIYMGLHSNLTARDYHG